ncbi:hypothetical protein AVEN_101144-1 [Araneus ventricosus]|uniref:Secreted protein n=1 Tax=Araneus ventricosus TaxID=182803 RepID=A0A4Y2DCU3_ARAVE|nr:hypothetical protein AVEN_101144-1 [Araneus ventricosus]
MGLKVLNSCCLRAVVCLRCWSVRDLLFPVACAACFPARFCGADSWRFGASSGVSPAGAVRILGRLVSAQVSLPLILGGSVPAQVSFSSLWCGAGEVRCQLRCLSRWCGADSWRFGASSGVSPAGVVRVLGGSVPAQVSPPLVWCGFLEVLCYLRCHSCHLTGFKITRSVAK